MFWVLYSALVSRLLCSLFLSKIPTSTFWALLRSFSVTPTPSSIRICWHVRMTRPRYASRPMYSSSGRSRLNLASSSCHPPLPSCCSVPSPLLLLSEGCSAPGTSFTSSGRYQPSVHGFILYQKQCISDPIE